MSSQSTHHTYTTKLPEIFGYQSSGELPEGQYPMHKHTVAITTTFYLVA